MFAQWMHHPNIILTGSPCSIPEHFLSFRCLQVFSGIRLKTNRVLHRIPRCWEGGEGEQITSCLEFFLNEIYDLDFSVNVAKTLSIILPLINKYFHGWLTLMCFFQRFTLPHKHDPKPHTKVTRFYANSKGYRG